MDIVGSIQAAEVLGTIFYTILGASMMWGLWKVIEWMSPFPIVKEIEEDQNIALAVLIGSVFVALAIIIAAVILS